MLPSNFEQRERQRCACMAGSGGLETGGRVGGHDLMSKTCPKKCPKNKRASFFCDGADLSLAPAGRSRQALAIRQATGRAVKQISAWIPYLGSAQSWGAGRKPRLKIYAIKPSATTIRDPRLTFTTPRPDTRTQGGVLLLDTLRDGGRNQAHAPPAGSTCPS
jgi:hypothetical protein